MIENSNCLDKLMNGIANDVDFQKILSNLDFPMESCSPHLEGPNRPCPGCLEDDGLYGDWDAIRSPCFEPIPLDALMGLAPSPRGRIGHASKPKSIASPIENDGAPEQKPLTCIEDTSNSSILNQNKLSAFQTHGPSSVLESSGSYSVDKGLILKSHVDIPRRARSKQRKSRTTSSWILTSSISSAVSASDRSPSSGKNKEAKRKKSSQMPDTMETINKKCTHCEVTKTPQWREGPMGPRTLCINACGIRYRSGHLFPEYRPAASPTSVPSLHSNSHEKIIEMRNKGKKPAMEVEGLWYLHK